MATTAIANKSGIVFKLRHAAESIRVRSTLTREVHARRRPDPQPFGNNREMRDRRKLVLHLLFADR
jgi:hypothetical protein